MPPRSLRLGRPDRGVRAGDVAVSPKRSTTEANGKLLNDMAVGLPTIACDGPVARNILGDAGVFVPPADPAALAKACITLLDDPDERRRRGEALRERAVTPFSWEALGRRLVDVYRAVQRRPAG